MRTSALITQTSISPSGGSADVAARLTKGSSLNMVAHEREHEVHTPLPGVFYRHPGPGKPPYVSVGDAVDIGQPIGLVEIMKQFSEVKSTARGIVERFTVADCSDVRAGSIVAVVRADS